MTIDLVRTFRLDDKEYISFVSKKLEHTFRRRLVGSLRSKLSDVSNSSLDQLIEVDSFNFYRIISAPETHYQIRKQSSNNDFNIWLHEALFSERLLAAGCDFPVSQWTALGDRGCNKEGVQRTAAILPSGLVWDWTSPVTQRTFQQSSYRSFNIEIGPCLTDELANDIYARVGDSVVALAQRNICAFLLVKRMTRTVVGISDLGSPNHFTSASSRASVGQITLVNAHLAEADIIKLMTALVHESVHSFLYRMEHDDPLVIMQDEALSVRLISPWSGNMLGLPTALHACYVYFALFHLLRNCLFAESALSKRVIDVRYHALSGFIGSEFINIFEPYRAFISERIWLDLFVMVDEARAEFDSWLK
jgi:hypothetical protein